MNKYEQTCEWINAVKAVVHWQNESESLQSSSSRDDLDQLLGDDGLAGAVEGEGQLINHLGCKRMVYKKIKY